MILFFDCETTGLPDDWEAPIEDLQNWPRLVQLAFELQSEDGKVIESYNYVVRPDGFNIPESATQIHKISNSFALENGVRLNKVISDFIASIKKAKYLVGHNLNYDIKIISAEFLRCDMDVSVLEKKEICTMNSSIDFCAIAGKGGFKWPKLSELYFKLFKKEFTDQHNALNDLSATIKCFWALKDKKIIKLEDDDNNEDVSSGLKKWWHDRSEAKWSRTVKSEINLIGGVAFVFDDWHYSGICLFSEELPDLLARELEWEVVVNELNSKNYLLNGFLDWRLPTIEELQTINYYIKKCGISKKNLSIKDEIYWSSTEYNSKCVMGYDFNYNTPIIMSKTATCNVLLVRDPEEIIKSVLVGSQLWMDSYLKANSFRNGDKILLVENAEDWNFAVKNKLPAYAHLNYDKRNNRLPKLYNYYAIIDQRSLAPKGFTIPTSNDWEILKNNVKYNSDEKELFLKHNWQQYNSYDLKHELNSNSNLCHFDLSEIDFHIESNGLFVSDQPYFLSNRIWSLGPSMFHSPHYIDFGYQSLGEKYYCINLQKADRQSGYFVKCIHEMSSVK